MVIQSGLRSSFVSEIDAAIQATVEALKPLYHAVNQAEWEAALAGTPVNNRRLVERYFQPGNRVDWASHIAGATGEPLNVARFVAALAA